MGSVIIAVVITLLVTAVVVYFVTTAYYKKVTEAKIGNADEKAREIIDEAVKTAETKKREAMLEAKEESIRVKNDLDKEVKERRAEIGRSERRIVQKEENLDKKLEAIEKREAGFAAKEEEINRQKAQVAKLNEERVKELERISGLTSEQAKDYLLKTVEEDVKIDTAKLIKEMEHKAKEEADKKAKEYVVTAIQKCAADHVAETTISVVQLPNDEMKGRIIGREGRNIRTLETLTGVDLIIDDTPEAVILSGFDPIRREVARIALEKLIVDGRIHPARIEEMVEKAQKEVETMIREEGEAATLEVGVHGIHPELVRLLGRMKFRTSYGQNALKHSIEVAQLSGLLAADFEFVLKGQEKDFQTGLDALAKMAKTYLNISVEQKSPALTNAKNVTVTAFDGPNPAGNVGVQINHISPINKGETVWTLRAEEVIFIGRLFNTGRVDLTRTIALTGSEVKKPAYCKLKVGALLTDIFAGRVNGGKNLRYINGNVLTGTLVKPNGFLGAHATSLTVIPEGDDRHEFLGFIMPRTDQYSANRSYFSWLCGNKEYTLDARIKGGERHMIMSGEYDKVFPMSIFPEYLIKAIIAGDIDRMEALGIYEVAPEDFAVCEFVDSSKLELQRIVRQGLDMLRKEMC